MKHLETIRRDLDIEITVNDLIMLDALIDLGIEDTEIWKEALERTEYKREEGSKIKRWIQRWIQS